MPATEGGKLSSDRRKVSKYGVLLMAVAGKLRMSGGMVSRTPYC